ncbi:MAG: type II CAAX endopeptidase family protein [Candidatus Aminicenantaceae bacterium]
MRSLFQRYTLFIYVFVTYLFSWAFLYPCYRILLNAPEGTFPWLALIGLPGAYGPSLVALFMTGVMEGKAGVRGLLRKLLIWRVGWIWYALLFIVPVGVESAAVLLSQVTHGKGTPLDPLRAVTLLFPYVLVALPFGPLGEELGWRGFMLPRLLDRHRPWASGLILGFIWSFWHLASFSYPGAAIPSEFPVISTTILLYIGTIAGGSLVFTYFYLKTRGSVLIAVLLHGVFNASSNVVWVLFPGIDRTSPQRMTIYIINMVLLLVLGSVLLLRRGEASKAGRAEGKSVRTAV